MKAYWTSRHDWSAGCHISIFDATFASLLGEEYSYDRFRMMNTLNKITVLVVRQWCTVVFSPFTDSTSAPVAVVYITFVSTIKR